MRDVLSDPISQLAEKTKSINSLLNEQVPYFRCSDQQVVTVYYYLWSLYLNYYTFIGEGQEQLWHTQTAVNNFLGMHRYDAIFQIRVGSWTSDKTKYANGNVLLWRELLGAKDSNAQLPDNLGVDWNSGLYGPETIAHVIGAWQIYEHGGDETFLREAYEFYRELFWDQPSIPRVFGQSYDAGLCLIRMARELGYPEEEVQAWKEKLGLDTVDQFLDGQWQIDTAELFGSGKDEINWQNFAYSSMSMYPANWTAASSERWLNQEHDDGMFSKVPLSVLSARDMAKWDDNFAVTPDTNYYMLSGMFSKDSNDLATKAALGHLKNYNFDQEWGIPVAPEGYRKDFSRFGDQYSNFNAGKILVCLEGFGGLRYSMQHGGIFTHKDAMPSEWEFMEFRVPVANKTDTKALVTNWVRVRTERSVDLEMGIVTKTSTVDAGDLFETIEIHPWAEGLEILEFDPSLETSGVGRAGRTFYGTEAQKGPVSVTLELKL